MVVNRSRLQVGQVKVDALGYLGLFTATTMQEVQQIREKTPMEILSLVGVPVQGSLFKPKMQS
jgi:ATP adenylyltransferase/5',5'''-P-1,P-4-tetraphosphate phosphorylase II